MDDKSAERLVLEERASELGISFQPNIGDNKLQARVVAKEAELDAIGGPTDDNPAKENSETPKVVAATKGKAGDYGSPISSADNAQTIDDSAPAETISVAQIEVAVSDHLSTNAIVVDHIDHDGKSYVPGDPISLPTLTFKELEALGVVVDKPTPSAE